MITPVTVTATLADGYGVGDVAGGWTRVVADDGDVHCDVERGVV